jgi:hypothetical protein
MTTRTTTTFRMEFTGPDLQNPFFDMSNDVSTLTRKAQKKFYEQGTAMNAIVSAFPDECLDSIHEAYNFVINDVDNETPAFSLFARELCERCNVGEWTATVDGYSVVVSLQTTVAHE